MPRSDPLADILPPVNADDLRLLSSDLDELQDVVNRGDYVVLAGGPVIAWWGVCIAAGAFCNAMIAFGWPTLPVGPLEVLFGYIGASIITRVMKTHKTLKPWRNQAITTAWWLLAIIVPVFVIGCYVRHQPNLFVISGFECLVFAMVTAFSAMASVRRWLMLVAAGWIVSAILILFVVDELWRCLVFSLSCLAFMTAPGLYLSWKFRQERR